MLHSRTKRKLNSNLLNQSYVWFSGHFPRTYPMKAHRTNLYHIPCIQQFPGFPTTFNLHARLFATHLDQTLSLSISALISLKQLSLLPKMGCVLHLFQFNTIKTISALRASGCVVPFEGVQSNIAFLAGSNSVSVQQ